MTKVDHMLVEVDHLQKVFPGQGKKILRAVDDVSFYIFQGETLGLVGESGCGKTTMGRTMIRLYEPTAGQVLFQGTNVFDSRTMPRTLRREMQMIFQDPYAALNPRMTVGKIIGEPLNIHHLLSGKDRKERILALLNQVGLSSCQADCYPWELSGGQCQRVCIARALAVEPKFIICDEPVSALDVSIQGQVVNLFEEFQQEMGLTYLFISHDLAIVKHISRRVAVMYLGKIVEIGDCAEVYQHPAHPYTQALLAAVPIPDPDQEQKRKKILLAGDVSSLVDPSAGCRFSARCARVKSICAQSEPGLYLVGTGHQVACHFPG